MSEGVQTPATIMAQATMAAVKIHGPNSPDVIEGRVPLGHREEIIVSHPEQTVKLTYEQTVEMFGANRADELFSGKEVANDGDS